MITYRSEVTNMIRHVKVKNNISWAEVARAIGKARNGQRRLPRPDGVKIVMSGKFLPYKTY